MEEDRKSYKASTDSPLPHAGDEEVTGGDVGEREGEVVGDTTPTYGERRFSDFSLPHQLPACQQEQQMPVLSPHPPQPQPATSTDLLQLFQYMECYRQQDEYYRRQQEDYRKQQEDHRKQQEEHRRQQEEHRRQQQEEFRRQQEEHRRELEEAKFTALLQALSQLAPTHTSSPGAPPTPASQGTPASTSSSAPLPPLPQKAITQNPPPLRADATFQVFREWRCRWEDYAIMVDLPKLPREKQLIQM
ncbi:hypothetical protein Pcinc_003714 [Petrolisthes cinctipes]|uniref:Uncharacterized protein n=1 Tax=Petrolisthes cinctipes TaxID=88211 RepID=A0AAE1GHC7_PETCI|nr:hypothetical protein Pcinc_003714 [Petrolisthes cinctipes]